MLFFASVPRCRVAQGRSRTTPLVHLLNVPFFTLLPAQSDQKNAIRQFFVNANATAVVVCWARGSAVASPLRGVGGRVCWNSSVTTVMFQVVVSDRGFIVIKLFVIGCCVRVEVCRDRLPNLYSFPVHVFHPRLRRRDDCRYDHVCSERLNRPARCRSH